ncbi:recombinase RecQ, partial [Escherichia coli]|nr:recombinase RecQ [Escherichia coli]
DIPIIVATSAFGMGINKKDIRTIIHFHLSTSPSNYIQEIGRAGRDGELSQAISLFQPDDKYILETLLFADMITEEDVQNFEIGEFLAPDKQDVLTTLHSFYSIGALKQIFKQSFKRKQLGFFRMIGYCKLDQCRRKYLLEFFGEYPPAQDRCCDNDSNITDIVILNKKKVIRSIGFDEKL